MKMPHEGVYTRLAPSKVGGVGVFAIRQIPKGKFMFEDDDEPFVEVPERFVKQMPGETRKLYEDFCVLKDGNYLCPVSFNKLNPSWFLNHSATPNVGTNAEIQFYALRDIEAGEELVADYNSYSDDGFKQ